MHKKLQHMKSPQGTQDSPARSCLDLYLENPSIHDGMPSYLVIQFIFLIITLYRFLLD